MNCQSIYRSLLAIVFVALICSFWAKNITAQTETGAITGKVTDSSTGEEMVGAVVKLDGTSLGAICDLEGNFMVANVPPATYTVIVFMVGYSEYREADVVVAAGQTVTLNIEITSEAVEVDEVTVKARIIQNTEEALIQERREEDAMSDAVSAEEMSSSGSGDAAAAMSQVAGASVVGGKEVFVRGLGDRYMNVQLNGAELPSTSQYKRTVQMDIFPTDLLDNIVTQKTFTPDKPGSFTGGTVDIKTKSFPDQLTVNFSASTSYNGQASFQDDYLTYDGGSNWMGEDDGTREIPDVLDKDNLFIPNDAVAMTDYENAMTLDRYTKSFNNVMFPKTGNSLMNQSYSLTVGNQYSLANRPFGFIASLTYNNSYSFYDNGEYNRWKLTGNVAEKTELDDELTMSDTKSGNDVVFGGLLNTAYRISDVHEIGVNYTYNRTGEDVARLLTGSFPEADIDIENGRHYNAAVLHYNQRILNSIQLHGSHEFENFRGSTIEWRSTLSRADQEEPDMRYFNYHYRDREYQGEDVRVFSLDVNQYKAPNRYFREMSEDNAEFAADFMIPIKETGDVTKKVSAFKFGGMVSAKSREFHERRFQYKLTKSNYVGDEDTVFPDLVFGDDNLGLIDSTSTYKFGTHILESSELRSNYDGDQDVSAVYGMVDNYFGERIRLITGLRYEATSMNTVSADSTYEKGIIDTQDLLPSVNFVVDATENSSVRVAYGRTLARPSFREMAPFPSEDFAGGYIFTGNPELKRTIIDNFDLRLERYGAPGELMSASFFVKRFYDPIERVILNVNNEISYQNVDRARVEGIELELRKNLDFMHTYLTGFKFGTNLSLVQSEVDIPEREMIVKRVSDPDAKDTRKFQGQSPYVLNIDIDYENEDNGINSSLYFNTFGERLSESSIGATPYIFEQPRDTLNFSFSKKFGSHTTFNFSARNILDSEYKRTHTFKGTEFIASRYSTGRSFSIGLSYKL